MRSPGRPPGDVHAKTNEQAADDALVGGLSLRDDPPRHGLVENLAHRGRLDLGDDVVELRLEPFDLGFRPAGPYGPSPTNLPMPDQEKIETEGRRSFPLGFYLAANLKALRGRRGLTQEALAADMQRVGFQWLRETVAQIESHNRRLTLEEACALSLVLDDGDGELFASFAPISLSESLTVASIKVSVSVKEMELLEARRRRDELAARLLMFKAEAAHEVVRLDQEVADLDQRIAELEAGEKP